MTISSSLNAGVAGLNANATKLATISDNIANASTFGYRRTVADFNSLVLQGGGSSSYSAGGVRVSTMRLIDQRGSLVGSTNATDLAVDGRGMLPVTTEKDVNRGGATYPLSLMTTGSFRPDGQGYLKTESGMVLLGWMADTDGTIPNFPRVSNAGLQPVRINLNQFTANPTTEIAFAVNLPATATASTSSGDEESLALEYFNNVGISETLDVTFEPTVPTTGSSSGGTLSSVTTISGGAYNAATGTIPVTVAGGSIALSIGRPGAPDGMTQLSDSFAPVTITKNGSPVGNVTSVQVDSKGDVYAIYDQGFTRRIGQVPLVDVPNVNGLVALSNQTYQVSPESGPMFLWDAGDGPTGAVLGFAREGSATDVAEELTQLIVTQRAYSSNAKVIQTVDEMLQETQNIKR